MIHDIIALSTSHPHLWIILVKRLFNPSPKSSFPLLRDGLSLPHSLCISSLLPGCCDDRSSLWYKSFIGKAGSVAVHKMPPPALNIHAASLSPTSHHEREGLRDPKRMPCLCHESSGMQEKQSMSTGIQIQLADNSVFLCV